MRIKAAALTLVPFNGRFAGGRPRPESGMIGQYHCFARRVNDNSEKQNLRPAAPTVHGVVLRFSFQGCTRHDWSTLL